jgi:hypothetical protein
LLGNVTQDLETRVGDMRKIQTIFWLENLKGRDHSEDLGTDGKIIVECISGK